MPRGAPQQTDVLVVGAGPAGATLANLLGLCGVRTTAIDRELDIVPYPRAVGVDDESLRVFQTLGLADRLAADMIQNTPIRYYSSKGRLLAHVKPSAKPFGWARRNLFLQPLLEAVLREGATRFPTNAMRYGVELVEAQQDAEGVSCKLRTAGGRLEGLRARFLVGCDGGRSTVRKIAGIELSGETAADRWLVVDVENDELNRPYSAVYCHPKSPILSVPLPYRHRRFEFKLSAGEDEDAVVQPQSVLTRLAPLYTEKPLPQIIRSRVYWHHSRIAERFRQDRIFLAGDAAHLQPPFFGQGMNSGIRDVANLAWKLAMVVSGHAGERLLESYDAERRAHAREMVSFATAVGRLYTPANRLTEILRDAVFRAVQLAPGGKEYILQMKYKPMPRYGAGGIVAGKSAPAVGRMFMQPEIEAAGQRRRLDDVLGPWFAILGLGGDPTRFLNPETVAWWRALGARFIQVEHSRRGPLNQDEVLQPEKGADLVLEDVDGAFRDLLLARPDEQIVVLRPDRYVASVSTAAEVEAVLADLRRRLVS